MATNATVQEIVDAAVGAIPGSLSAGAGDTFWLFVCGVFVFLMQLGFALLEAGTVRAKNTKNILLKNLLDACVGAIIWWGWGHALAVRPRSRPSQSLRARARVLVGYCSVPVRISHLSHLRQH